MEIALDAEPKRFYSSWCERYVSPKNSKWLQDNLTDMDNKVKAMIKLIEEDADSFARRAEMYYKKRPDLMKLVDEFYRAYRALAERYDRVTGSLRQAHRTIAMAFPDQIQLILPDEPPSGSFDTGDEDTSESGMPVQSVSFQWDGKSLDAIAPLIIEEGLKHFNCFFAGEEAQKKFGESLVMKIVEFKEDEAKNSECKLLVEESKKLSKEKKDLEDQISMESMRADSAQAELQNFKDAISMLKSELEAAVARYQVSQKTISNLESEIYEMQEEFQHLSDEMSIKTSKLNIVEERCLGLERKNASLQLELDKLNRVVSWQQEEVSDCSKENKDLQVRFNSESKRADQAESESTKLRDAISKLKSEMESALLQYHVSQEKVSVLEAEISRTKEQFKSVCADMSTGASKLNIAEEQCLLLQEESKSLHHELERFKKTVTRQEEEIMRKEEELYKLQHSLKEECHRNMHAEIKEKSLQLQIHKLEKSVGKLEEKLAMKEEEFNELNQGIQVERNQRLDIERAHQSLVELHTEYEENMELLCLEVQNVTEKLGMVGQKKAIFEEARHPHDEINGLLEKKYSSVSKTQNLQDKITSFCLLAHKLEEDLQSHVDENTFHQQELSTLKNEKKDLSEAHHELTDKLRRMEQREAVLEEEMRHLHDENRSLNEKKFSSLSKIVCLQDEIILLRESKYRLEEELKFQEDEKRVLQQEIFSLRNERNVLEERHNEIVVQIEEVNINVISLQTEVKEMHDGNKELQDTIKRYEDEKAVHMEQLRLMENTMENNAVLDSCLSKTNAELQRLLAKIKGLEECCQSLPGIVLSHLSVKPVMVSHVEAVSHDVEKLKEKNTLLENFIYVLNTEFEVLRWKVKTLKESFQSLYSQKSYLFTGKSNVVSKVERVVLNLEGPENRFVMSEGTHVNLADKCPFHRTEELNCPLRQCKEEHIDHVCPFKSQVNYLNNHVHLLREENKNIKEELEDEQRKSFQSDIDIFIVTQCLADLKEKNLFLLNECWKYMEESKRAENFFLEFKKEWASQEKSLASLSACNEKLLEGIHVMECDTKKACESSNNAIDNILHLILHKIADLQGSILVTKDGTLTKEIFHLQTKNHGLLDLNEQLWKELDTSKQHEEMLNIELEFLSGRLSDLQEASHAYECEILKLLEENEFLSQTLSEFRESNSALEKENATILENAITQEHLSLIFSGSNAEKTSEIEWLIKDVKYLYKITNDLGQEVRAVNKNMRALEAENMHLKEEFKAHIGLLEDKIHKARSTFGRLNIKTDAGKQLLEQRAKLLFNTENKFQSIQSAEIPIKFEEPFVEIKDAKDVQEELESYLSSLSEDNACKNHNIGFQYQLNEMLTEELHNLQKVVEKLGIRENNLTSELQIAREKYSFYKEESVKFLDELHAASIMQLIFKEKFIELVQSVRCLETIDIVQLKMPTEEPALRKKFDALEKENKRLKAELNAHVPLVASLESEMASLEEKTLALTNLHILNSKRKQGNLLASLKRKKSIQMRGQHNSPRASAGIMELKKLRGKVKVLLKAVTDAERRLDEERVSPDANVLFSTSKSKARITSGSARLVEPQKDIILDLRKSVDAGKDTKLLKHDGMLSRVKHEQIMKDIELDHVLSCGQLEPSFSVEKDLALETWEPGIEEHVYEIGKMDVERSEKPSEELALLKDPNVDSLVYPVGCNESLQEWIKWVNRNVSADASRLLVQQNYLKELKVSIQASEMKCQTPVSEVNAVKTGVKEAEGTIRKMVDFNYKLSKMAENFSSSSDSKKSRRKALKRIESASEKITGLDLKLQKLHCILANLQEDQQQEGKPAKGILQRRSRIPLKDLIYGKRSELRQKKRRFCACMRLKRSDSNLT